MKNKDVVKSQYFYAQQQLLLKRV